MFSSGVWRNKGGRECIASENKVTSFTVFTL